MEQVNLKDETPAREMESDSGSSSDLDFDLTTADGAGEEVESDSEEEDLLDEGDLELVEGVALQDVDDKNEPLTEEDRSGKESEPRSGGATQPVTSGEDKEGDSSGGMAPGGPTVPDSDGDAGDTVRTDDQEKTEPVEDIDDGADGDDDDQLQRHLEDVGNEPSFSGRQLRSSTPSVKQQGEGQDSSRKEARVGPEFQAVIPEFIGRKEGEEVPILYEDKDLLVWDPNPVSEEEVVKFLTSVKPTTGQASGTPIVRDDEHVLSLFMERQFDFELAKMAYNSMDIIAWKGFSDEECLSFEKGLREYGKKFYLIQQNFVPSRTVGELVQFYYLWKATERYDEFKKESRDLVKLIMEDEHNYIHYLLRSNSRRYMPPPEHVVHLIGRGSGITPISTPPSEPEAVLAAKSLAEEPPPEVEPLMTLGGGETVVLQNPEGGSGADPPSMDI